MVARAGARERQLNEDYVAFLDRHEAHHATTLGRICALVLIVTVCPIFVLMLLWRRITGTHAPYWMYALTDVGIVIMDYVAWVLSFLVPTRVCGRVRPGPHKVPASKPKPATGASKDRGSTSPADDGSKPKQS